VLSTTQIAQYHAEGWCTTGRIFSHTECDAISAAFEALHETTLLLGETSDGPLAYQPMLFGRSPLLTRMIADSRLVELVVQLVGPDARMFWEQLVAKPPQARTELPWHQDDGYAPTNPPGYLTCWIALDDADQDNGCIWVLPGSHRKGVFSHKKAGRYFRSGIEAFGSERAAVPAPVRKGEILLFHSLTLHRSGPNVTDRPRRAWIVQYCDSAARHGNTGEALDDRVWIARDGQPVAKPWSERPMDVPGVFANWTPVED